jgi:hypothetical protein
MKMGSDPSPRPSLKVAIAEAVRRYFGGSVSRPVVTAMIEVLNALLLTATAHRGWYGRLTLWSIARAMTCAGKAKSRYKRLTRLLGNLRFDLPQSMRSLIAFSGIAHVHGLVPVLIDQTSMCKDLVQTIVACFVHGSRSIPIAIETFEHCGIARSQTFAEWKLIKRVLDCIIDAMHVVFVMDRGYAKSFLLHKFQLAHALFIVRGCRNVIVQYHDHRGSHRLGLGRLPHREGVATRYRNVRYLDGGVFIVDIVVFRGRGFKEPWFLIIPSGREDQLPTDRVVEWYRWRMRIEVTFRDFKSYLGVRKGLHLLPGNPDRMARMLVCLAIVYIVLVALGETEEAAQMRRNMEVRRRTARHGTRRTLSVLTIAFLVLSELFLGSFASALQLLKEMMNSWTHGLYSTAMRASPDS